MHKLKTRQAKTAKAFPNHDLYYRPGREKSPAGLAIIHSIFSTVIHFGGNFVIHTNYVKLLAANILEK